MCAGTTTAVISSVAIEAVIAGYCVVGMNASRECVTGIISTDIEIITGKGCSASADTACADISCGAGIAVVTGLPITVSIGTVYECVAIIVNAVSADFCRSTTRVRIFITWLRRTGISGMLAGPAQTSVGAIAKHAVIAGGKIFISAVQNTACRIGITDPQVTWVIEIAAVQSDATAYTAIRTGVV